MKMMYYKPLTLLKMNRCPTCWSPKEGHPKTCYLLPELTMKENLNVKYNPEDFVEVEYLLALHVAKAIWDKYCQEGTEEMDFDEWIKQELA